MFSKNQKMFIKSYFESFNEDSENYRAYWGRISRQNKPRNCHGLTWFWDLRLEKFAGIYVAGMQLGNQKMGNFWWNGQIFGIELSKKWKGPLFVGVSPIILRK